MPQTPNHSYNVPNEGTTDWHKPLNENFEQYDTDIEVRDQDSNRGDYEPKAGAKFLATDTGAVYVGDGSNWTHVGTTGPQPTLSGVNTGGTDLGVGTATPATKLHVRDDPAKNGAMDLSRPTAVVENTSGDPKGDVLGLKSHVSNPDSSTDFLSFIGGSNQLGQLNGNGATGIRLGATGDLTLAAGGADLLTVEGNAPTVTVGDMDTEQAQPKLHIKDKKSSSNRNEPTLTLEGDNWGPGIDFRADGSRVCQMRHNTHTSEFQILPEKADVRIGNSGRLVVDGQVSAGGGLVVDKPSDINADLQIRGNVEMFEDLSVRGNKNFVQPVDTPDGEKDVVYTASEAPTPRTEISGVEELENGRAEIDLPDHFGWVTDDEEPLVVQTTPYGGSTGLKVVERSPDFLVVEDLGGDGEYEFAYTVTGTREGYADKEVVRESVAKEANTIGSAPADD